MQIYIYIYIFDLFTTQLGGRRHLMPTNVLLLAGRGCGANPSQRHKQSPNCFHSIFHVLRCDIFGMSLGTLSFYLLWLSASQNCQRVCRLKAIEGCEVHEGHCLAENKCEFTKSLIIFYRHFAVYVMHVLAHDKFLSSLPQLNH